MTQKTLSAHKSTLAVVAVGVALSLCSTSCGIYKKYETPDNTALTRAYTEAREAAAQDSGALGNLLWEQVFTDPVLQGLINRALANNTNLKDAQLNVGIARAQLKGARLAYLPSVTLTPNGSGSSMAGSDLQWSYQLPGTISWEFDIFGKLLNSKRGAAIAVERSEAYAQAARSQIISAVASTYYTISAIEAQLNLTRSTARLWQESVNTMRDLKQGGRVTEAAVVQSDAQYQSVLATVATLEDTRNQLDNTMSALLHVLPQHFEIAPDAVLNLPGQLENGVPMEYLGMRPDVLAAERGLAAAYYTTASARVAFYPSINISFTGGFTNQLGTMIKNPGEWFYNLAGSLTAPLFARGQNIARLEAAKLSQQMAMNEFERTVLNAAAEVSNTLVTYSKTQERAKFLAAQVEDLKKSVEYTNDLLVYSNGTYLEVLTAQQSLLGAQTGAIQCHLDRNLALVSLYQEMGGGR